MATHEAGSWEKFQQRILVDQETDKFGSEMDPKWYKTGGFLFDHSGEIHTSHRE